MYIGIPPFGQTVRTVTEKVAVQDQVDFYPDGGYLPGYVDIEMNGQSLLSTDFFATDGVKITLVVACNALDEFRSVAYWPVSMVDTYRKAEADARYLNLAGGTLTGGLTAAGNFLMTANSGNARVVGVSNGTNTTLVLQGGGNGAGALGGNIELGRDGNNMYDATVSRFRSLDGSTVYGEFNASGFGIGTNTPQRRVHFYDTGIFPLLVESNHIDAVALEIKHSNTRAWAIAVAGPTSAVGQTPGNFYLYDEAAGTVRFIVDTSGNLKFNSGFGSNGTAYGCRAWINFNGQTTSILGSGNISSLTRVNTGCFDISMTSAMPDSNYSIGGSVQNGSFGIAMIMGLENYDYGRIKSTTGIRIFTRHDGYIRVDSPDVSVNIFR